ncbi:MAG TPA: hypothetical protein VFH31_20085 [Pyrinomonadaceae bacterium]|nr:hypothetical protein [Pyrinomonadaceae bacterium]
MRTAAILAKSFLVVSPEGQVLKVWMGVYIESLRPEVEAYFGIQLPVFTSSSQ